MHLKINRVKVNKQRGVVLIVALVMLLIVTLLGVAAMQGARMQMKMTNNAQERQQAFNAAEATLAQAEQYIANTGFPLTSFSGCAAATCFTPTCSHGYCFRGVFNPVSPTAQRDCSLGAIPANQFWEDQAVWTDANRHQTVQIPGAIAGQQVEGQYIIEFRCFIDGVTGLAKDEKGDILYRITARGISSAGNSRVMVQSTFRSSVP